MKMFYAYFRYGLLACLLAAAAWGQGTFATITGIVQDATGAVVPNASIEATHIQRNTKITVQSNEAGQYTIANLVEGTYSLTVKATGFQEFRAENIILTGRDIRRIDASIAVGQVGTAIEVSAGATLIETETARIVGIKEREILRALPLTLRRAWDYFTMTPQVERTSGWTIRFAGTGDNQSESTLDGTTLAAAGGGPIGPLMDRTEQVQEMRVDIAQSTAEHATMGQIALVSRAGTNDFHGTAADYYSDSHLNSRNPFNLTKGKSMSHQFVFSGGGPVYIPKIYNGKNRTFFFTTLEIAFGGRGLNFVNRSVPALAWRTGDFSRESVTLRDPLNGGAPFANNRIPSARLNPVSQKYQDRFIVPPNFGDANTFAALNYREVLAGFPFVHQPALTNRFDHRISEKQFIYGRWTAVRWNFDQPELGFPQLTEKSTNQRNMDAATIAHTYTFRPTLLNEFLFGLTSQRQPTSSAFSGKEVVQSLGLQGVAPGAPDVGGILRVNFENLSLNGIATRNVCSPCNQDLVQTFADNVSWFRGNHSWKFGANMRRSNYQTLNYGDSLFGLNTFSNRFTGHTYADFMLGLPSTMQRAFPAVKQETLRYSMGWYVQDSWKPTPRLTLNLGLRWDAQLPWNETSGRLSVFDIATGKIVVPDGSMNLVSKLMPRNYVDVVEASAAGYPAKLIQRDLNNFQPRLGAAWRPWDNNTVFRGGFGLAYNQAPRGVTNVGIPFVINEPAFTNPLDNPYAWPNIFPSTGAAGPSTVSLPAALRRDLRVGKVIQYSATIEHQRWDTGFQLSYNGTGTRQGVYRYNINQPVADTRLYTEKPRLFPNYPDILYADNGAGHMYHALTAQAQRRMKSGLHYQVYYTLAKDIGDLEDGQSPEDAYNRTRERALWERLAKHRFSSNVVYELPFGHGRRFGPNMGRIANGMFGGWRLSAIVALESGRALTPLWTGPDPTGTRYTGSATRPVVTLRPDNYRDPAIDDPSVSRWFDVTAFGAPVLGRFGTAAKGTIISPGTRVMHNALGKEFFIYERLRLRVEALATNTLNHPNWGDPNTNITAAGQAGVITATTDRNAKFDTAIPREMQIHVRFEW